MTAGEGVYTGKVTTMKKLVISEDLSLPIDAATETFGILGRRGSGKSHTGSVMAEEMLKVRVPIVAYDPTGAWYGLKSSVDGKSAGYPVVIFGGEHADIPLAETDGEMIARAVVAERFPAILDCSLLRKGARLRLMADFLETLYHENREAIHFFADELHTIAPLNLRNVGDASVYQNRCVGAIEDIILQGRRRGIGMTGMSQRPALVNANVRSQFGTLIAMQINAPLDRKAIAEWIEEKGTEEEGEKMLEQLPRLERGTGIVWSTVFNILKTVKFRARETFDSGRTPGVGEKRIEPKAWAEIDINALGATIAAKREEKKANDPKELRRRIGELEKQLAAKPAIPAPVERRVEVPVVTDAQVARVEKIADRLEAEGKKRIEDGERLLTESREFRASLAKAVMPLSHARPHMTLPKPTAVRPPAAPRAPRRGAATTDRITARQQRMLNAAATLATLNVEVSRETVCGWLGIHPRGGSVGEELKALAEAGLIDHDRGQIVVTDAGMAAAEQQDASQAIEHAKGGLSPRQRRIFDIIVEAHPGETTREVIAEQMQIHPRGGSFGEDLGRLVGRGLIEGSRGTYRARDFLFAGTQ